MTKMDIEPDGLARGVLWAGWMVVIGLMFCALFSYVNDRIGWSLFSTLYIIPYLFWATLTIIAYVAQFRILSTGSLDEDHLRQRERQKARARKEGGRSVRYSGASDSGRWDKGKVWDMRTGDWERKDDE